MVYKQYYELVAQHVTETRGDLRIVPMYEKLPRHAAEKVLRELDDSGLITRAGEPGLQRQNRILASGRTPEDVAIWLSQKAEGAPVKEWRNCIEDDRRYDPDSSVLVVGGPCAVFERGHWFIRSDFAATLFEACWEPGMVVKLRTRDKADRCFIVCGDLAPLDIMEADPPAPQWLEEVQMIDGVWSTVDGGLTIVPKDGKRVTLKEIRP